MRSLFSRCVLYAAVGVAVALLYWITMALLYRFVF
jgi:hypothetical protein